MRKFVDTAIWCVLALCVCSFPASPHDHGKADNLANAKNKNGALCCDGKDWSEVLDYRRLENGWRIQLINNRWVDAPANTTVENQHSWDAKVWLYHADDGTPIVRCFLPGVQV